MKNTRSNGLTAAAFLLVPASLLGQMTGTSHPESLNDTITVSPATSSHYVKPSPAVHLPASAPTQIQPDTYIAPTPVLHERAAVPVMSTAQPMSTASMSTAACALPAPAVADDPNGGVVIDVDSAPNELPAGTLLHTSLAGEISTIVTQRGEAFTARLTQPVGRKGEVLLPAGSIVTGRVAAIHAGNRLHGGPAIQLVPESITLPDGGKLHILAQVVDLPYADDANVNSEGVIRGKDPIKRNAITAGATTATATVAGAMIGGGVGAAVGATVGAGVATVWWLKHNQEQTLADKTEIVFSLDRPLSVAPNAR